MGTRIISLSGRPPVRIDEADWPTVAEASGDSAYGHGAGTYVDPNEVDTYAVKVRQHADGRAIVYAIVRATDAGWGQPAGGVDWRGGELLEPGSDIAAALERVGVAACAAAGLPDHLIREAIQDLPAERL